jgi:phage terminase Nu1 subunit (DNA packaging protein)
MIDAAHSIPDRRRANKAELAAFFDVSLPTIESWVRRGCPVVQRGSKGVSWVFDLLQVSEWKFSGMAPQGAGEDGEIDPSRLPPAERKAWFESEIKRRDLQVRDGELIPASDLELCIATAFAAIAQGVRAIPDNLERRIGCGADVAETVGQILDEEMSALADRLAQLSPVNLEAEIDG